MRQQFYRQQQDTFHSLSPTVIVQNRVPSRFQDIGYGQDVEVGPLRHVGEKPRLNSMSFVFEARFISRGSIAFNAFECEGRTELSFLQHRGNVFEAAARLQGSSNVISTNSNYSTAMVFNGFLKRVEKRIWTHLLSVLCLANWRVASPLWFNELLIMFSSRGEKMKTLFWSCSRSVPNQTPRLQKHRQQNLYCSLHPAATRTHAALHAPKPQRVCDRSPASCEFSRP